MTHIFRSLLSLTMSLSLCLQGSFAHATGNSVVPVPPTELVECEAALTIHDNPPAWRNLNQQQQFEKLLLMMGSSYRPKFVSKDLFENADFALGIPFSDHRTLGLEYVLDTRFSKGVLRLSEVFVVDGFGNEIKLLDEPFERGTGRLRKIKKNDMLSREEFRTALFPLTIEGPLLEKLMASKSWLDNVTQFEIRQYADGRTRNLYWMGHGRWLRTFLTRDMVKYSWRILVFGSLLIALGTVHIKIGKNSMATAIYEALGGGDADEAKVVSVPPESTAQLAAIAASDLESSQVIDATERNTLLENVKQNKDQVGGDGEKTFDMGDIKILSSDVAGRIWILEQSSQRLFTSKWDFDRGEKAQVKIHGLIEIKQKEMPKTYAKVMALYAGVSAK